MDSKLLFPQGNYEISCTVNECKDMNLVLKNVIKQPVSLTKNEEIPNGRITNFGNQSARSANRDLAASRALQSVGTLIGGSDEG